jgi:hypothetical protein
VVDEQDAAMGSVAALWHYPVKSMMGEELNSAAVTERGLLGDRAYALVDSETGKIASAKNPRKWPTLFDHRAVFTEPPRVGKALPPVRMTLPDGVQVTSSNVGAETFLSGTLGRDVTLAATAPDEPEPEEYWPDIEGLDHKEIVTDETIPEGTSSTSRSSTCCPRRPSTASGRSTQRAASRRGASDPTSSSTPGQRKGSWRTGGSIGRWRSAKRSA